MNLEKAILAQMVKKLLTYLKLNSASLCSHKPAIRPHLESLESSSRSPQVLSALEVSRPKCYVHSLAPKCYVRAACPDHVIQLGLIVLILLCEEYKL